MSEPILKMSKIISGSLAVGAVVGEHAYLIAEATVILKSVVTEKMRAQLRNGEWKIEVSWYPEAAK